MSQFRYVVLDADDYTPATLEVVLNEYGADGYRCLTPGIGHLFILERTDG